MPFMIELPESLAARLTAAGLRPEELNRYAVAALTQVAERAEAQADSSAEVRSWWTSLTDAEREAEVAKTTASLAAADEGRTRPAEEVYDRIRAKYANTDGK